MNSSFGGSIRLVIIVLDIYENSVQYRFYFFKVTYCTKKNY